MKPENHADCRQFAADKFADMGIDATVTTAPPIVRTPYTSGSTCPHGETFWHEPTSEQIAQWAKDGVS